MGSNNLIKDRITNSGIRWIIHSMVNTTARAANTDYGHTLNTETSIRNFLTIPTSAIANQINGIISETTVLWTLKRKEGNETEGHYITFTFRRFCALGLALLRDLSVLLAGRVAVRLQLVVPRHLTLGVTLAPRSLLVSTRCNDKTKMNHRWFIHQETSRYIDQIPKSRNASRGKS